MTDALDAVRKAVKASTKWVDSLDRSALGRFVIPQRALVLGYAIHGVRFGDIFIGSLPDSMAIMGALYSELDALGTPRDDIENELSFWLDKDISLNVGVDEDIRGSEKGRRLAKVASYPIKYHDYFANHIWDIGTIDKMMAEGIDAELAARAVL